MKVMKLACMLSFFLLPLLICAQDIFEYTYDMAGNRVKRRVIVLAKSQNSAKTSLEMQNPLKEKIGNTTALIYPNPTKGMLTIRLEGDNVRGPIEVAVVNLRGVLIDRYTFYSSSFEVDLTSKSKGIYVLKMKLSENEAVDWKIIKE